MPVLFKIGPFNVYSYGLMMGIGFLVANYFAVKEFKRRGLGVDFANQVTMLAVIFGIGGSKILSLMEYWGDFLKDPIGMAFSPGGLTWYGGFLLATAAIAWAAKRKGFRFLTVADALVPALAIGYGVARLGCHFSGDGDYGMPTKLPWGVNYSSGIVPPSIAFRDFPAIAGSYPGGIVPIDTLLHPTPIYEFLAGVFVFWILWRMRTKLKTAGTLSMLYLVLAGTERFLVEFIRLNPRLLFGLSEAQLVSVPLIVIGFVGYNYFTQKTEALST